ncbi:carboxylesterase [Ammoniphilus sp. CFH 90114]|uniref:alpha/beta hydrolase n=1 Tax=Ammoniphilus sp. CFH 90114 TaxID=2493665 RepID=UPI00100F31D7|nr:alpha/beta fold hydrolase [Ammoniphilus sp. CFH 90114]RXT07843.1 alpha/beta fold hydrolase [Ammoniphilus sp. CFH 90114]
MEEKRGKPKVKRYLHNQQGLKIHHVEHHHDDKQLFILSHGFTGSSNSHVIASLRKYLNHKEISNVSVDFTNNLNDSDGSFRDHTITGEIEDLKVVYDAYRNRYERIYLIGHSMGCTVSANFALQNEVDGLLLVAPPFSIRDIILGVAKATYGDVKAALAKWEQEKTFPIYNQKDQTSYPLAYEFYRDLSRFNPVDYQGIQARSVIIYSNEDPVVPPSQSVRLFNTLGTQEKKILEVASAPHSFDTPTATEALIQAGEEAVQFLGLVRT